MTPTNELRFVEREIREHVTSDTYRVRKIRVLQQKWIETSVDLGFGTIPVGKPTWRDVPLEDEV